MSRKSIGIAGILVVSATVLPAESPFGESSYSLHERQRRQAIADQIGTQEHLRWLSGLPSRLWAGRPYSLESIYSGLAYSPGPPAPWKTDIFELWPFVPGDIYGRQFDRATPQPWGHRVTPTGPNGYVYEPIYDPPSPPGPPAWPPLPLEQSRPRPAPVPPAVPEELPLPPPVSRPELREF